MSISIVIPTNDRPTLARTLDSVESQLEADDEVIVVGDTHDGPLHSMEDIVLSRGPRVVYHELDAGHHCFGHCQINYGIRQARGAWLSFMDNDDIYTPDALAAIRRDTARHHGPILFRFITPWRELLWRDYTFAEGRVGGHCIVVPNTREKLGRWSCRYQGDWDFIAETVRRWGGVERVWWADQIIAITRP